jgi:hypothetical protein
MLFARKSHCENYDSPHPTASYRKLSRVVARPIFGLQSTGYDLG